MKFKIKFPDELLNMHYDDDTLIMCYFEDKPSGYITFCLDTEIWKFSQDIFGKILYESDNLIKLIFDLFKESLCDEVEIINFSNTI